MVPGAGVQDMVPGWLVGLGHLPDGVPVGEGSFAVATLALCPPPALGPVLGPSPFPKPNPGPVGPEIEFEPPFGLFVPLPLELFLAWLPGSPF